MKRSGVFSAWAAVGFATLATELANLGFQPLWQPPAKAAAWLAVAVVIHLLALRWLPVPGRKGWERAVALAVLCGVGARVALVGGALEWTIVEALRIAALAMLAIPVVARDTHRVQSAALGVALFLVLACSVLGSGPAVIVAVVGFMAAATLWLAHGATALTRLPWGTVAASAIIAGGASLAAWTVHGDPMARFANVLPAWVQSSGGDGAGSDHATRGVGDGPDQLDGANGSAGFDQSDVYCETDGDCLYDAFVESYGAPYQPSEVHHAQWLSLKTPVAAEQKGQDLRHGKRQGSRGFSLNRQRTTTVHDPDAVLWVEAEPDQFPLRLPVLAFDHYHGGHWHEQANQSVQSAMDNADEQGWFTPVDQPVGGVWGGGRTVTVRTGTYDGNVLPMPGGLTSFRMGRVTRADLFGSASEPMLRVNRRSIPAGSVLEARYRPAWRAALADEPLARIEPTRDHPAIAALARQWAGDLPHGWAQVQAILTNLKEHAVLDASVTEIPPADHAHVCPVETFLHDSRRGEAYHFASAAVLMLRSLGYDARLVGGYHVIDADDARSAAVMRTDAHTWPQVRLAAESGQSSSRGNAIGIARGGQWIDLEATPGFELADGTATLSHQVNAGMQQVWSWVARNWPALLGLGVLAVIGAVLRRRIADLADVLWWHVRPTSDARLALRQAGALLDRRAARRGLRRPAHLSLAAWLRTRGRFAFADALDWALHAPAQQPLAVPFQVTTKELRDALYP